MDKAILKVYPAQFWSDDVVIIGNREGLARLKAVTESALAGGEYSAGAVQETDGYQYAVRVKMLDGDLLDEEGWSKLPTHYADTQITNEEDEFLSKFLYCEGRMDIE